jgi:hypothetical protein
MRGSNGAEGQRLVGAADFAIILRCPLGSRCSGRQSIVDVEDEHAYGVHLMAVDVTYDVSSAMIIDEHS